MIIYKGTIIKGYLSGNGISYDSNTNIFCSGFFIKSKLNGSNNLKATFGDESFYCLMGDFVNNVPHGSITTYSYTGEYESGDFVNCIKKICNYNDGIETVISSETVTIQINITYELLRTVNCIVNLTILIS